MKNRKFTKEQRKAERRLSPKNLLLLKKIRQYDNPLAIAQCLYHEFCEDRLHAAWLIRHEIMRQEDPRFIGRMLIALGEYILKGQPIFDKLELDISEIMNLPLSDPEMVTELEDRGHSHTRKALTMRVRRFREALNPKAAGSKAAALIHSSPRK